MKEEGLYQIKRVNRLPEKGNANLLYSIKNAQEMSVLYRWLPNGTYEEISLGTGANLLAFPVENVYVDSTNMFGDQANQTTNFFQYVIDIDTYYEYLGTTNGDIDDYRELTADEVTIITGRTRKPVHRNYADLATMYLLSSQRRQRTGWIYRVNADNSFYEYLGTRNGDATDYIQIGGGSGTGLEALNEGNGTAWRLVGKNAANYGNLGNRAIDISHSSGASSTRGSTGTDSFTTGLNNENPWSSTIVGGQTVVDIKSGGLDFSASNIFVCAETDIANSPVGNAVFGERHTISAPGTNYNTQCTFLSLVSGGKNDMRAGHGSALIGNALDFGGPVCTVVGVANLDETGQIARNTDAGRGGSTNGPRFIVGCGILSDYETRTTTLRDNGLVVWGTGDVKFPMLTPAKIDAADPDTAITREYLDSKIQQITVPVNATELKNLGTTPKELIPAPGVGNIIRVTDIRLKFIWNSVAFDSNGIQVKANGASDNMYVAPGVYMAQTSNSDGPMFSNADNLSIRDMYVDNAAIELIGVDSVATGDSTMEITLTYVIEPK